MAAGSWRRAGRAGPRPGSRLRRGARECGYRTRVTAADVVTRCPYLALTRTR